jgi:hypothetical protein
MPRFKQVDGVKIQFTTEEETARDAEELEWANAKPMNDWKESMQGTDNGMPRMMEDLITSNASLVIPAEMKVRYDEKIKIRAEKP